MSSSEMHLARAGMACPVGLSWTSACAAMRAGISRKVISRYLDNDRREILTSRLTKSLQMDAPHIDRCTDLLAYALRDLLRNDDLEALSRLPVFLSMPAGITRLLPSPATVSDLLHSRLGLRIPHKQLTILSDGSYGTYACLERARALLATHQACIVAAADSLVTPHRLFSLASSDRLLVEGQSDGVIAGEAAAAVLLSASRQNALATIRGIGLAEEPSSPDNDTPLRADGLVAASRAALRDAMLDPGDIDFRVSDAAGEGFYFKEQALLTARLLAEPKPSFPLWLVAETLGDTGVAAGLCGLIRAAAGWQRKYAPGPRAIACAGAGAGGNGRAAVVLERVS